MRNVIKSAAATVMCAMIAASVAPTQAGAGVVGMGDQAKIGAASPVQPIYYHHYYRHYYHHPHYVHHYYYRHYYGYYPYYYNPGAALVGTAAAAATFPFWGWGYPYYW